MSWEDKVTKWGEPEYGIQYFCKLKCFSNEELERYAILIAVDEDDYLWQYQQDELSNNWHVEYWIKLDTINKVIYNDLKNCNLKERQKAKND